jgi:hypothetical protein
MVSEVQDSILYAQLTYLDSNKGVKGVPFSIAMWLLQICFIADFLTPVHW